MSKVGVFRRLVGVWLPFDDPGVSRRIFPLSLIANVERSGADNVDQFAGVERGHQFSLAALARDEFLSVGDHLTHFDVTVNAKKLS